MVAPTCTESAEMISPFNTLASSRERSVFPTAVVPAITSTAEYKELIIMNFTAVLRT